MIVIDIGPMFEIRLFVAKSILISILIFNKQRDSFVLLIFNLKTNFKNHGLLIILEKRIYCDAYYIYARIKSSYTVCHLVFNHKQYSHYP